MQLGDAAAAVLYNNTSYLTTSAIASPTVSQETGKDTNLLALFAAIRRDSPFAAVNFLCVLRVAVLVAVAASVFLWKPSDAASVQHSSRRRRDRLLFSQLRLLKDVRFLTTECLSYIWWPAVRRRRPSVTACSFLLSLL